MFGSFRSVAILTASLVVVFVASALAVAPIGADRLPLAIVLVAANTLPLLAVPRQPLLVLLVLSVAYPTWVVLGFPAHLLQSLPTFTAMYAAGAWDRPLWLRSLGLLAPAWMLAATLSGWWETAVLEIGYVAVMFVVVWLLGSVVAGRQAYAGALEARTIELEAARRALADRAVADERARIARELHDVVAHAMSVITVQAGVGAHLVDDDPSQAATSLAIIERTGRDALDELRRMLSVLRDPDAESGTPEPQPRLVDLASLVERAGEAGVELTLTTRGSAPDLPPGLELAVYRVVQEAVTNIAKHAPGSRGRVEVSHEPGALLVRVSNALRSTSPPSADRAGQGLRGMAERVALYDGDLETTIDHDGFHLTVRFPVAVPA